MAVHGALLLLWAPLIAAQPAAVVTAAEPAAMLLAIDEFVHLEMHDSQLSSPVRDYLVALGAVQKIRGVWAPSDSERVSGLRTSYTWKLLDGYTSAEVLEEITGQFVAAGDTEPLFACEARACGRSVQWANRIFRQRLLYGVEVSQRYRAYRLQRDGKEYRLLLYSSYRTGDRQYLHAEVIELDPAA
ncbi:MAG: hypothetical protein ACI87W_002434 [Halieaceae bacterium]|jgi:hypothetical protein